MITAFTLAILLAATLAATALKVLVGNALNTFTGAISAALQF